jgi:hypothetical protein
VYDIYFQDGQYTFCCKLLFNSYNGIIFLPEPLLLLEFSEKLSNQVCTKIFVITKENSNRSSNQYGGTK